MCIGGDKNPSGRNARKSFGSIGRVVRNGVFTSLGQAGTAGGTLPNPIEDDCVARSVGKGDAATVVGVSFVGDAVEGAVAAVVAAVS